MSHSCYLPSREHNLPYPVFLVLLLSCFLHQLNYQCRLYSINEIQSFPYLENIIEYTRVSLRPRLILHHVLHRVYQESKDSNI
jgi:hypothetical protein